MLNMNQITNGVSHYSVNETSKCFIVYNVNIKMFYGLNTLEIAYIIKIICHVLKFLFHRRNNVEICRKNRNTVEEEKNND